MPAKDPLSVLLAPDAFKGTFDAGRVVAAMERGARQVPGVRCDRCPLADGGEGLLDALTGPLALEHRTIEVRDPLGRPVAAAFGIDGELAVVEAARASGIELLRRGELDPWHADSYGTGELIAAAVRAGARRVLVGAGGVATVDGGAGAIAALDDAHVPREVALEVLCDVTTPWEHAAVTYGPQKGADSAMVERLAARLDRLAEHAARDPRGVPMTGAAGGLSGALWAARGARLHRGAERVLSCLDVDRRLAAADLVLTGEGCLDAQTAEGKLVAEVAARASAAGCRAEAIVGRRALREDAWRALGLAHVSEGSTLDEIAARAAEHVAAARRRRDPDEESKR